MIEIITKDDCVECKRVKSLFDNAGIKYKEINLADYDIQKLIDNGIMWLPVIIKNGEFTSQQEVLRSI